MTSLILVLLLVWFVITVFLAAWTLWFQTYIYTEPVAQLAWRAPAAGTVVFLTLLLWVVLDYRAPERYSTLWEFSPTETIEYASLIVPQRDGKEDEYKKRKRDRGIIYQHADRPLPSRPEKIIAVQEDGGRDVYEPDRDARGKFKVASGQGLVYRDAAGHVMEEGQLGRATRYYYGRLFLNLFLNFFHLLGWFVALWVLLRFQWSHALGLAVVLWLVMQLFIVPQVLKLAEDTARRRPAAAAARAPGESGKRICLTVVFRADEIFSA